MCPSWLSIMRSGDVDVLKRYEGGSRDARSFEGSGKQSPGFSPVLRRARCRLLLIAGASRAA